MINPTLHTIVLKEIAEPKKGSCKFIASCSCNWQGLTHELERAETFIHNHAYAQAERGNQVIIKRELQKPSLVDDPQE